MQTGERQATNLRLEYLSSVLDQDIGVFDTKILTGEVTTTITSDIILIQDAISEKVCELLFLQILLFVYNQ